MQLELTATTLAQLRLIPSRNWDSAHAQLRLMQWDSGSASTNRWGSDSTDVLRWGYDVENPLPSCLCALSTRFRVPSTGAAPCIRPLRLGLWRC